jgi:outer membrane protein assembly factor BamB
VADGFVYQTVMDGKLYVLDAESGEVEWTFSADGRLESSPLVLGRRVLFGSHKGTVYAVNTERRSTAWSYRADDAVKGSIAVRGRTVYFGTYGGQLTALRLGDGSKLWSTQTRRDFAFGGSLYSTPALAYGRVYVGSTDGRVYSIGAKTGEINWVRSTGDWVYASPAVAWRRVFVGSYDGKFYALDARTGDIEWTFSADDRIAGSATVIGPNVYFSSLAGTTYALDAKTGRVVWTFADGRYSPVVADTRQIYLTGHTRQYAFKPAAAARTPTTTRTVRGG